MWCSPDGKRVEGPLLRGQQLDARKRWPLLDLKSSVYGTGTFVRGKAHLLDRETRLWPDAATHVLPSERKAVLLGRIRSVLPGDPRSVNSVSSDPTVAVL